MEQQLFTVVASAIATAPVTMGITEVIKGHTNIKGIQIILTALSIAIALFGSFALVFDFPLAESLLTGVLSGFASVGAFKGIDEVREWNRK